MNPDQCVRCLLDVRHFWHDDGTLANGPTDEQVARDRESGEPTSNDCPGRERNVR